jgi:hypothetical protein
MLAGTSDWVCPVADLPWRQAQSLNPSPERQPPDLADHMRGISDDLRSARALRHHADSRERRRGQSRLRCREYDERGKAAISIEWAG